MLNVHAVECAAPVTLSCCFRCVRLRAGAAVHTRGHPAAVLHELLHGGDEDRLETQVHTLQNTQLQRAKRLVREHPRTGIFCNQRLKQKQRISPALMYKSIILRQDN